MHDSDHHRRSIRLRGYDYAQGGCYFFTVCTQDRTHRFGEVIEATLRPNAAGRMAAAVWQSLAARFPAVGLDSFVAMPDHLHGIFWIQAPEEADAETSVGTVVGNFKSLVTAEYIAAVRAGRWPPFNGRLFQRNYHEHIVRSDEALDLMREYILNNPARWAAKRAEL